MKILRKLQLGFLATLLFGGIVASSVQPALGLSGSDFRADRIIDDSIFFDSNSMGAGDIQAFLNSKMPSCDTNGVQPYAGTTRGQYGASKGYPPPYTCLNGYSQDIPGRSPDAYCSGGVGPGIKTAAQIIKDVSVACSINPKVMIILLQKEQSLVTDDWPWASQYERATGYYCPDDPTRPGWCDPEYAGFFNQVWYAARQFQRYGNGSFNYAVGRNSFVPYQANNAGCGGTNITMQTAATAALYNYTPYQPNAAALSNLYGTGDGCSAYGNRNFWRLFNDWFGSSIDGRCITSATAVQTSVVFHKTSSRVYAPDFHIYSGSGSGCVESHVWNPGFTSWRDHIASNQPNINSPDAQVVYGDIDGSGGAYPILFGLRGTGSGMVESHVWNPNMKSYLVHTASNLPAVDPSNCKVTMTDLEGDGKDKSVLICWKNTGSGNIEMHEWLGGMQSWAWHTTTNMHTIDATQASVTTGDINGDGRDELILIAYNHTGSSRVEFHVWNPGQWSWQSHYATNLPEIDPANANIQFADIDGDRVDEAVLSSTKATGSGRIEFHIWNPGFTSWRDHIASNQPSP
jgi:hypothetical protein